MAVGGLELQKALLVRCNRLLAADLEIKCHARIFVQGTRNPLTGATLTDFRFRDVGPLLPRRRQPTDGPTAFDLARRQDIDMCIEPHLQVSGFVAIEHLAEGFLEDAHAKTVAHHHTTSGFVGHDLHLQQPNLIQRASIDVDRETASDGSRCQIRIKLDRALRVSRVRLVLLQIQVRPNGLDELLPNDHARPDIARPTNHQRYTHAALRVRGFNEPQGHADRGTSASQRSPIAACRGPGISRQVIQQRHQSELAICHRHQKPPCHRIHNSTLVLLTEAELVRDLLGAVLFGAPKREGMRHLRRGQLMDVAIGTKRDKAH
mmetsp:Transcript_91251/g.295021  ORF Transcript_91251/g.295021 Transcript_91251/m.295021 type:complete len:319 (+) Transcript_91251:1014-1970(+)